METVIERLRDHVSIVERPAFRLVGFRTAITPESQCYLGGDGADGLTDWAFVRKLTAGGELRHLAAALGLHDAEVLCARTDIRGDGDFDVVAGFEVAEGRALPAALPERCGQLAMPAARYVRMEINQSGAAGRTGFAERMHANEYFIGDFRKDARCAFDAAGCSFAAFDGGGDLLYECTPVVPAETDDAWFATLRTRLVLLPPMSIACKTSYPGGGDSVIYDYFRVQSGVVRLPAAARYVGDYYGFPIDVADGWASCFGSRVSSFDCVPENVDRVTLPGGLYLHIWQLEYNGDNPTWPYKAAFEKLNDLYLLDHPGYQFDKSRKVVARFRQANCASVFVPLIHA
ncbi:MAG: GyrI-like domain-containing protein [Clostridiales bacterium]|nr:GyrI-like domain-containing protein [Clostridiales bacterium]